ncbi:unnamed protein product [Musa textilis]
MLTQLLNDPFTLFIYISINVNTEQQMGHRCKASSLCIYINVNTVAK